MEVATMDLTLRKGGLISLYLTSNIMMNLLNRWMLGLYPFPFPLFMTACHMTFQFVVFFPYLMRTPEQRQGHITTFSRQGAGLVAIGIAFAANIALNNLSLVALPLSMNQIIRSSMPVVVALMAVGLEGRYPSRMELGALTVLCTGVATTVTHRGDSAAGMDGILICGLSVVACAIMMCTSGRVMKEKVDALRLSFYTSPISAVIMLPLCYIFEGAQLSQFFQANGYGFMWYMLVSCLISVLYNVVHSQMIHETSSTTTTVIGQVKVVLLLIFGALFLGESKIFSPKVLLGCVLAMSGFAMYSWCKLKRAAAGAMGHTSNFKESLSTSSLAAGLSSRHGASNSYLPVPMSESSGLKSKDSSLVPSRHGHV